jgi:hypothetical protein
MKDILWGSVKEARKLGSFTFVCLAIVIWVGVKSCFAFFQDAILHSLQEWLLSRNLGHQPPEATSDYRVVTKAYGRTTGFRMTKKLQQIARETREKTRKKDTKNLREIKRAMLGDIFRDGERAEGAKRR